MQPRTPAAIDGLGLSLFKRGKILVGAKGGGTTANHSSFVSVISAWFR